jgi:Alpha/beta hydrolase of unknown function (DUF900)
MHKMYKMAFVIFFSTATTYSLSLWAQSVSSSQVLTTNLVDNAFGQEINDSYKVPLISTVGDFNHTTGKLITGHNPIEYNASNIPGLQINDCPPQKEIAIYINGFLVNGKSLGSENATEIFDRARLSLNNTGYDVTLIGFNWDSDIKNDKAWEVTKDVAKSNGLKLAQFILDFKKDCPQTDIRLIAHSLGSRIVLSSLDALNENQEWNNQNFTIASVHLLGAAVDNEEVSKDPWDIVKDATNDEAYKNINIFAMEEPITLKGVKTAFGEAIEDEVRNFSNLYSSKDDSLEWFYPMMEGNDTALGQTGTEYGISLPSNYKERDVKDNITALCDANGGNSCNFPYNIVLGAIADVGDNHFGYVGFRDTNGTLKNNGAMDVVVEDWNKQNELENKTTPDDNS